MKLKMKLFARNIVNPEAITDFITKVSKGQSDKIKVWCNTILKNYLKNEYSNLKEVTKSKKTDPTWLQEAVKRKDAQKIIISKDFERLLIEHIFHYFDTLQGNNIKHSFSEADKQTKEWENKESLFNIKLTKGVKEILKCNGGYTWFEITDEETLYNEGEIIQNCLRKKEHGPEYWKQIKNKEIKIFTLRDSKGIGHVGVEYKIYYKYSNKFIEQMKGKQNDDPIEIYHPSCIELIKYLKCTVDEEITKFLNIVVSDGEVYEIFNLPDNLIINGDLDLTAKEIKKLPNGLQVIGNLDLDRSNITELPDNLRIGGSLSLYKTKIISLPENLEIGDTLDLRYTKITTLPKDLKIGNIWMDPKMKLKSIPKHLIDKILVYI